MSTIFVRPALLSKAPYMPYFRCGAARTRASRLEDLTRTKQSSKSSFLSRTYCHTASTIIPPCTYLLIRDVEKVAECDTHRPMAVAARVQSQAQAARRHRTLSVTKRKTSSPSPVTAVFNPHTIVRFKRCKLRSDVYLRCRCRSKHA